MATKAARPAQGVCLRDCARGLGLLKAVGQEGFPETGIRQAVAWMVESVGCRSVHATHQEGAMLRLMSLMCSHRCLYRFERICKSTPVFLPTFVRLAPPFMHFLPTSLVESFVTQHDRMVNAIRPFAEKILHTKGAWAVPVAALIIVSIPPLFGHEIIILVVGIIWGLAMGFLIAILGTFLGELLIYYLFKHFFRERAVKIEKASQLYANLAEIMRRDGLWMIALVRFSAVPGHVTTGQSSLSRKYNCL